MKDNRHTPLNLIKQISAFMLAVVLCASVLDGTVVNRNNTAYAAPDKTLTLKACRLLAIQNSPEYENAEDKVESKQAAYESAVKAIALKQKSMSTFRWSPLLSFKFPTKPFFDEASEFQYKPIQLSYEIRVAQHNLQDKTFEINEKVNNLYVEIVVLQRSIEFNEKRAETLKTGLAKNQARVRLGQATQADVDKINKKLEAANKKIASDKRNLEADLQKLSTMLGTDVTTGYKFENPFIEASIDRSQLDALIQYTEDRDEQYYEACINETTAREELTINYSLIKSKYKKGDVNMIAGYVNTSLKGGTVNKKAFKKDYKNFLNKIDSYWKGKKRICLFVKVPKLWLKGNMDGTRYIDDDPYVLYQNVLDYNAATNEKKTAKINLDQQVKDSFNNYISVRNAYRQNIADVEKAETELDEAALKNRVGELSFDEYDSQMEEYEELQNSMLDNMKLYAQTLYSFDRLTCGGISALLSGTDADMRTAVVGTSYVEKTTANGAYYTMRSIIQNQEFELSISIPEDFEVDITDYELWIDNVLVGTRTAKDTTLRHLALTTDAVNEVKIRLYNGDEFVDDCIIDPSEESGPLKITSGYEIKKDEGNNLGKFEINTNETTQLLELTITPDDPEVKQFKVFTEDGKTVGGDKFIDIKKPLVYISVLTQSIDELKVEFYDESGGLLHKGRFDSLNMLVKKLEE